MDGLPQMVSQTGYGQTTYSFLTLEITGRTKENTVSYQKDFSPKKILGRSY